jgi:hypothetical protein
MAKKLIGNYNKNWTKAEIKSSEETLRALQESEKMLKTEKKKKKKKKGKRK